jgi:hypothetical protein
MSAPCLRSLPDKSLVDRLSALVKREHECTIDVLHHLNEVERRRLHRDYGYASLFRYCTERLGYSASAASRRIATARAINRYPAVLELLARREVSLTTVYKVAGIAFKRDDPSLFERIRGKSQGAVDEIVAGYDPKRRRRDRVQTVYVHEPVETEGRSEGLLGRPLPATASEAPPGASATVRNGHTRGGRDNADASGGVQENVGGRAQEDAGVGGQGDAERPARNDVDRGAQVDTGAPAAKCAGVEPGVDPGIHSAAENDCPAERLTKKYRYTFLASEELKRALDRARSIASLHLSAGSQMEDLLTILVQNYLDRHCPQRRQARREKRRQERKRVSREKGKQCDEEEAHARSGCVGDGVPGVGARADGEGRRADGATGRAARVGGERPNSRYIPAAVRDEMLARAGYRCSFVGVDGVRCTETAHLQIDHISPVALGGSSVPDNLRVLCPAHNILEAERLLGRDRMARYSA